MSINPSLQDIISSAHDHHAGDKRDQDSKLALDISHVRESFEHNVQCIPLLKQIHVCVVMSSTTVGDLGREERV